MKRIILLMLAATVVAAFGFAVFIVPAPRAKMTVQAIGPTNATFPHPPGLVWNFAITNKGPSAVNYRGAISVPSDPDWPVMLTTRASQAPAGMLAPGQGVVANMLVPSQPGAVWCPYLIYTPVENSFCRIVRERFMGVRVLGRLVKPNPPRLETDAQQTNPSPTLTPAAN
jgi:hypothetical protein